MSDLFESTGPDIEKDFGVVGFTYTLDQLVELAKCYKNNKCRIVNAWIGVKGTIWPKDADDQSILEFAEDIDRIRRDEPLAYHRSLPSDYIAAIKVALES